MDELDCTLRFFSFILSKFIIKLSYNYGDETERHTRPHVPLNVFVCYK